MYGFLLLPCFDIYLALRRDGCIFIAAMRAVNRARLGANLFETQISGFAKMRNAAASSALSDFSTEAARISALGRTKRLHSGRPWPIIFILLEGKTSFIHEGIGMENIAYSREEGAAFARGNELGTRWGREKRLPTNGLEKIYPARFSVITSDAGDWPSWRPSDIVAAAAMDANRASFDRRDAAPFWAPMNVTDEDLRSEHFLRGFVEGALEIPQPSTR